MAKRKQYTLMLLPENGGTVRKFVLGPRSQTWLVRAFVFAVFIGGGLLSYTLVTMRFVPEYFAMRDKISVQQESLVAMQHRLETLQEQLGRMRTFEQKLRVVLGHSPVESASNFVGIGGPSEGDLLGVLPEEDQLEISRIDTALARTSIEGALVEMGMQDLHNILGDQGSLLASTPSIWPVRGWVTSKFGRRLSPFTGLPSMHDGIDVAAREGATVLAPADGIVTFAGAANGYGNVVVIDHGYELSSRYGHLLSSSVRQGQKIRRGQEIGLVGNTGRSTAPHLHYEVRLSGVPVDPMKYILLE